MVQRIKALCKEKGITVAELERRCFIGNGIIARWKTSKPSYERLSVVAKELDTTVDYLLTGEEQKGSPPQSGELSEKDVRLIEWFRSLPPEKQKAILISQDAPKELID